MKRSVPVSLYGSRCKVYRNLNDGCLSVKVGGIVRGHAMSVEMADVSFTRDDRNWEAARDAGVKNVHAYAEGVLIRASDRTWAPRTDGIGIRYAGLDSGRFCTSNNVLIAGVQKLYLATYGKNQDCYMRGYGCRKL